MPGVKSAALAAVALLSGDEWDSQHVGRRLPTKDGEDMQAFMNCDVSRAISRPWEFRILAGRDFDRRDMRAKIDVAIVNEGFARHFFGNKSAVGRHLGQGGGQDPNSTPKSSGWWRIRSTKVRVKACVGRCLFPTGATAAWRFTCALLGVRLRLHCDARAK